MDAATLKHRFTEFNLDPALAEMVEAAPGQQIIEAIVRLEDPDQIPPHFTVVSRFKRICTGRFAAAHTWTIRRHPNVVSLKAARPLGNHDEDGNSADLTPAQDTRISSRSSRRFTGRGCIVAALDFGLDFAHPNFLNPDGLTRLVGFWHQGAPYDPAQPNRFGYGRIFSQHEINTALRSFDPYQALGYHPANSDAGGNGSHGTHTMDIAAGNGRAHGARPGAAPDADLIFVHLSTPRLGRAGNLGDSVRLLEALDAVNSMARGRPWVVNLSVGRTAGCHDGTSLVEQGMQELLRLGLDRAICQSCGNYRSADLAVDGWLRDGEYRDLEWIIDPADTTPNEIDAWYSGRDRFVVGIRPPQGSTFTEVKLGEVSDIVREGALIGRIYHRRKDPNNGDHHIEVFLYPGAPSGVWTVRLSGEYVISGRFHAWIERDLARPGAQSRFDRRITSQSYTLGTIATSPLVITVGAYDANREGRPLAPFSSCGPTRDERREKPELLAPGVDVVAARSIPRGAGRQQGLLVARSGTSMAAPHVAGTVCAMFEAAGRSVSIDEIRDCLKRSADPLAGSEHLDCSAWGRLDAAAAIRRIRNRKKSDRFPALRANAFPNDEGTFISATDRFLDRAEHSLRSISGRRHQSETDFLQRLLRELGDHISARGVSPAQLFRAILSNRPMMLSAPDVLEVLALPAQRPESSLQRGDWMIRAVPGTGDVGHVAILASDDLLTQPMLAPEGIAAESAQPGYYGSVIEAGAFPHSRSRPFARRWLDERGFVPPHTLVLRPNYSEPEAKADYPEDEASEYPNARIILESSEASHETEASEWSPGSTAKEAEDPDDSDLGEDEPVLKRAIEGGSRDENELTNIIFFARHPKLPPAKLDSKDPNFERLSSEWSSIREGEVWKAIQASAENSDLVVSGEEVTDHHRRFFRGKSGKRLKTLVENAATEAGLNPGLLGTIMMAETRRPQSYLATDQVSSYHIGLDDFFEARAAIKARVPAYDKVRWDRKQKPVEHLNDAKKNRRIVKTIWFDSGPDAVLATAVYVKFSEVRLRELAAEQGGDFDSLPLPTRMALTRMAMAAGTGGATRFLKEALKGNDIFVRKAIPVAAFQTQRNATVRTAQAMHLSDWVFGIRVPAVVKQSGAEAFGDSSFTESLGLPAVGKQPGPATVIDPFPAPYPLALDPVNASFNACVDAASTDPDVAHLCGALVDLTGKLPSPPYRGHNHNDMLYVGSLAKIYPMFAAYELMHRVEVEAMKLIKSGLSTNTPGWQNKIFAELKKAWGPKLDAAFPPPLPSGFPRLADIFQITPNGNVHLSERSPPLTDAELDTIGEFGTPQGKFRDWMRLMLRWSNNSAASKCILALSYPYINGVLGSGGFFDKATRNGLWISGDYLGHDWLPGGRAGQPLTPRWAALQKRSVTNFAGTACQVARLLTLIAQGKLIDGYSSIDMISIMQGANGIGSYIQTAFASATPPRPFSSISSKIGYGNDRFSHDCAIVRVDHGDDPARALRFVTVILGSPPGRGRADLTKLAVAYYDCVKSRHP